MTLTKRWGLALTTALILAGCGGPSARPDMPLPRPGGEDGARFSAAADSEGLDRLDPDDHFPFRRRDPQPTPPGREGVWLAVSNHNHSSYWDGSKPLTVLQQEAYLKNIDAVVLTDHNTMRGTTSHEFLNPPPGLIMVKGMEWNAWREHGQAVVGHAGLLGMKGDQGIHTGASLDEMLSEATRRDATVVINHPFCKGNEWTQPAPDPRAHAIEVWNGHWYKTKPFIHNDKALAWWDEALRAGRQLTAMSGTDYHGNWHSRIANGIAMVYAEKPDAESILEGIRRGRVSLTGSPTSARLYLEADVDGDGIYESMMGDRLPLPASGQLHVRARVIGGAGKKVVFYTAKGRQAIRKLEGKDATVAMTINLADGHDYVRAEVRRFPHLPFSMTAIANPIYVGSPARP
ncbi:MAG: CehA/McbA family metallohydrolase [Candidatus Sericytochromatia bacterium]